MSEPVLDKKISALPAVTGASLADSDKFPVVAGGVTSFINKAELASVLGGGGGGEINTSSNQGLGVGLALPKVGVDLPFKSLIAGTNITLTDNGNDVTIDAAAGGGGASPGGADGLFQYNNGGVFGGAVNLQFNDTTGNISVGGGAPAADSIFTVEATRPLEKIANFRNVSATGFGLKSGTGDDSKYGLAVADAADLKYFQVYGRQFIHFGLETSTQGDFLLQGTQGTSFHIEADPTRNGGSQDAAIWLTGGALTHRIAATGDNGLRIDYNFAGWPVGPSGSYRHSSPGGATIQLSVESSGWVGLAYEHAPNDAAGTYDTPGGKTFIFMQQGLNYSNTQKLENATLALGNPKRGFSIARENSITDTASASYEEIFLIKSKAADANNPIYIMLGGVLKQLTVDGSGFVKAV